MKDTHVLTRHTDIQNWVSAHHGLPAIVRVRNHMGVELSELHLRFERPKSSPPTTPNQDDGMSPVSWSAWLAELDRQHLALRVSMSAVHGFEFIDRKDLH